MEKIKVRKVSLPRWDWAAKSRSESKLRAWATHQNKAPLLFGSQEHQQACEDRGKAWTTPMDDAWEHEGIYILHVSVCVRVTVWLDPVRIPMSTSAAAPLPVVPAQPTDRPQSRLFSPDAKWGGMGSGEPKIRVNLKNLPSCCEGDCGITSRKIWAEHKWWWQIIVEAVELGFLYAAQTWCTVFEYIKNLSLGLSWFGCI